MTTSSQASSQISFTRFPCCNGGFEWIYYTGVPNAVNDLDTVKNFGANCTIALYAQNVPGAGGNGHTVNPLFFRNGTRALDTNDYFVYDRSTGFLYYDDDGNGSDAQVHFMTLTNHFALTAQDIVVFG